MDPESRWYRVQTAVFKKNYIRIPLLVHEYLVSYTYRTIPLILFLEVLNLLWKCNFLFSPQNTLHPKYSIACTYFFGGTQASKAYAMTL